MIGYRLPFLLLSSKYFKNATVLLESMFFNECFVASVCAGTASQKN